MFEALDSIVEQAATFQREQNDGQTNLFAMEREPGEPGNLTDTSIPDLPEWEELTKLSFEKELMGFYVTGHPLMKYEDLIRKFTNADSSTVAALPSPSQVKMAGIVKKIKEINTRKGERMAFVNLEDLRGIAEVTVFSELYRSAADLLQSGEPVVISGTREGEPDTPKVLAQEICRIKDAPRHFSTGVQIKISTRGADPDQIKQLKKILARHRGRTPVKLHVVIPNRTETVINLGSVGCDVSDAFLQEMHNTFGYQPVSIE
jgi:DNA polymerase-3 subunit alpha